MLSSRFKTISALANKIMRFQTNEKASAGQEAGAYEHQMKVIQQKAYLAEQIKSNIMDPTKRISEVPLKYQILDELDQNKSIHEDAKVPFRQLFDDGYQLKKQFTGQQRVKQAVIMDYTQTKKVAFYPTEFVTGEIFQIFLKKMKQKLFYGHFGISKTFSAILYKILNDFIVDYKIRCSHLSWPAQLGHNIINCSKVIYWSIDIDKDNLETFKEMLMNQMTQAEKEELKKLGYFDKQNKKLLKHFYSSKGIQLQLIIDQINVVVSQIRKIGYKKKRSQTDEYVNYQGEKKKRSQIPAYKTLDEIIQIIEMTVQNFDKVTFQSSINLERRLFNQLSSISLNRKQKARSPQILLEIQQLQFGYIQCFKQKNARLQMVDCFLYEFEETYPKAMKKLRDRFGMSKREMHMNLRNQLIPFINEDQFYVTHYSMKRWIDAKTTNYFFKDLTQIASLQNYFKQIFPLILKNSIKDVLSIKVEQFLNNTETLKQLKYYFLLQLFILFEKNILRGLPKQKLVKINKDDIKFIQQQHFNRIQQILDRHLFKVEGGQIELLVPPNIFFDLKMNMDSQILSQQIMETVFSIESQAILRNVIKKSAMGSTIETMLILGLSQGSQDINIWNAIKKRKIKSFQSIEQKVCTFNALPHADNKLSKYSFPKAMITGLQTMINKLKLDPQKLQVNQIFLPLRIDQKQLSQDYAQIQLEKSNDSSKAIDFILVNFQNNQFIVNAFDVTITSDIKVIDEKLQKFLDCYQKIQTKNKFKIDDHQYNMKVNYYVLSSFLDLLKIEEMLLEYVGDFGKIKLNHTNEDNIKANKNKEQLLGQIGHISLNSQFKIQSSQGFRHKVHILPYILEFLEQKAQKKEQMSS